MEREKERNLVSTTQAKTLINELPIPRHDKCFQHQDQVRGDADHRLEGGRAVLPEDLELQDVRKHHSWSVLTKYILVAQSLSFFVVLTSHLPVLDG